MEASAFAFARFEVMFVLYTIKTMHSYISEKKLQTDTVTITILGLRGFDIRAKGVDVLQAKVPFQALQSVKSSEDKSTLFDFIRCLFFPFFPFSSGVSLHCDASVAGASTLYTRVLTKTIALAQLLVRP